MKIIVHYKSFVTSSSVSQRFVLVVTLQLNLDQRLVLVSTLQLHLGQRFVLVTTYNCILGFWPSQRFVSQTLIDGAVKIGARDNRSLLHRSP